MSVFSVLDKSIPKYVLLPRSLLTPGTLDASDNLVDTNISGEDSDVQAICNAAWTTQVKADYKAFLIANKPS